MPQVQDLSATLKKTLKLWTDDEVMVMDLHTACGCGDVEHVTSLLDKGEDANRVNRGGELLLVFVCVIVCV